MNVMRPSQRQSSYSSPQRQAGIVSLIVTFLMMIVISLLVLGFSEATRRDSREALDRQLSTQAYYAAETGVNDAIKTLKNPSFILTASDATTCQGGTSFVKHAGLSGGGPVVLNSSANVAYTCLLVNGTVSQIKESSINLDQAKVETIHMSAPGPLQFSWYPQDHTSSPSGCPASATGLPAVSSLGCNYALLRVDLVPAATPADAVSLASATHSFYFKPTRVTTNPPADYVTSNDKLTGANCSGTQCKVTLNSLPGQDLYARLSVIYHVAQDLAIDSTSGIVFTGAQIQVDATGQAQDELRRIQVRIPLSASGTVPVNALSAANGICKRFIISGNNALPDYNAAAPALPLCQSN